MLLFSLNYKKNYTISFKFMINYKTTLEAYEKLHNY